MKLFTEKNEATKIEHWLKVCDQYWPKLPLLKQAAMEAKVSLRTGKGNRHVLKAKLAAINQRISEANES